MLVEKQIKEIREHLEKAQNPIFYYDNDADGFCSFVLLRKFLGRGKGVAVRSFPDLNARYARKARELKADYVFILDKPVISKEFVDEIKVLGLPMIWVDHHDLPKAEWEKEFDNLFVYNTARNKGKEKSDVPVTYSCFKVVNKKEDIWLAVIGCIADHHMPDFFVEFSELYPDFSGKVEEPFDAYYGTEIGRIARALNFGLKDSVSNVVRLQNFFISCKNPGEVLEEVSVNYSFRRKYSEVRKKYEALIEKAKQNTEGNLIFFEYAGELSISADIANELSYLYPQKYIAVAYKKGEISNVSLRGKNVKRILEGVLKEIGGTGGGHVDAVGARISTSKLENFKEALAMKIKNA